MKLIRLEIEGFGKLRDYAMELTDGLNVLCEENGFGKTTLAVFIKAMLYGLPASTKRDLDKNERKKYAPWQGGNYGGSLEFESEKGRFRIERFFGAKEASDEFRLFDLSTNKPSDAYSQNVGIELFGIDAEGFARSAFLAQNGMDAKGENVSLTAKLTGLLEDVNDMGSYDDAMEMLEKHRRIYEVKGGRGRVSELNERLSAGRRELDRLNELLTAQKQQETSLETLRAQIAEGNREQEALARQLRLNEQRRAYEAERDRLREQISNGEQEQKTLLSAFRDHKLPTGGELSDAKRTLQEARVEQSRLQAVALPQEEAEALERLRQRYHKGPPSDELLTRLHTALNQEAEVRLALLSASVPEDSPEQLRFQGTTVPTEKELVTAMQWVQRREQIKQSRQERAASQKRSRRLLWILSLAALLAGGGAWIASLFLHDLRLTLQIIGSVVAAAGLLIPIFGRALARSSAAAKKEDEELNDLTKRINALLEKHRFLTPNGDTNRDMQELNYAARHALADAVMQEAHRRRIQQLRRQSAEAEALLRELFDACGFSELPRDPRAALLGIHADLREWEGLAGKARAARSREEVIREDLNRKQAVVAAFLSRLTEKKSQNPEDCIEQIEELCHKHAILENSLQRLRAELLERESAFARTAPQQLPSEDALLHRERELSALLEQLRSEEAALHRQWNRCAEETQSIPAVEDELAHLSMEYAEAERRLSVLKKTEQFLTDAKEALSTRYLSGMQAHFDHYRAMLEGADTDPAVIDTAFAVSVRAAGKSREAESFSRGERDILQLCARLSLTASMFEEGERPPILLDDPFVNLDQAHLASAKGLLHRLSEEFQIIYTVCHPERC